MGGLAVKRRPAWKPDANASIEDPFVLPPLARRALSRRSGEN